MNLSAVDTPSRWHFAIVALVVFALRVPLLGDQPYSDEGVNAAMSYFNQLTYTGASNTGWLLPRNGTLGLYPLLTSWVYFLPWEPFFLLRTVDAVVTAAACMAVYQFLITALNHRLIALISSILFALAVNHPVFIDAGYKNSIMVATTFSVLALAALHGSAPTRASLAGLLMAGAVLFREFFLPIGFVVALYALIHCGRSGLIRFMAAGLTLGIGVITILVLLRGNGGFEGLISSYLEFNTATRGTASATTALKQGSIAGQILLPLFPLVAVGLVSPAMGVRYRDPKSLKIYFLGILLAVSPALEIWYKLHFPYHFSQSVLGLIVLLTLGLRVVIHNIRLAYIRNQLVTISFVGLLVGANLLLLNDYARQYYWQVNSAAQFAPVMIGGDWKADATEKSVYLRAARTIRENTPPSAKMITEYMAMGLFPLSSRSPSIVGTGVIDRVLQERNQELAAAEMTQLVQMPPDVLVLMPRKSSLRTVGDLPSEYIDHYSQKIVQERGLSPYGGRSIEIYLR